MENFLFSINATIPIFLVILLGYILKRLKLLNDAFLSVANKYVFRVGLPVMLFKDLAFSDVLSDMNGTFIIFCIVVTWIVFLGVWGLSYLFLKDKTMVGAFSQGAARSSAAILGVAFVENICGNAGMAPLMIAAAVPFFNIFSVIILVFSADMGKEDKKTDKAMIKKEIVKSLKGIVTNPIIIGIFVGLLFNFSGLKMPVIPMKTIEYISSSSTPLALLAIGGGFELKVALTRMKPAIAASLVKLIALPMIFVPIALKLGFAGSEMVAILIMLASPTTISCFVMAKEMGNDEVLTSNIIVITTLLSSVTLTAWVYILRVLGAI